MLFSLAAFYAGLVKLTAYYLALFFAGTLTADWLRRTAPPPVPAACRQAAGTALAQAGAPPQQALPAAHFPPVGGGTGRAYLVAIGSGLALLAAYLLFCHLVYGSALARLEAFNAWSEHRRAAPLPGIWGDWGVSGFNAYAHRIVVESTLAWHGLFGIAYFLALIQAGRSLFQQEPRLRLIALYFLGGIAFLLFTPISPDWQHMPLLKQGSRYSLFLAPAVAALAAKLVSDLFLCAGWRRLPRFAARAVAGAVLLAMAAHGWRVLAQDHAAKSSWAWRTEIGRQAAMRELRANDQALLALSDFRNYRSMVIYAGFDPLLYSRVRHCDASAYLQGKQELIVYVDKPLSAWLAKVHGRPNCNAELLALARARGHRVLLDNAQVYLSTSAGSP